MQKHIAPMLLYCMLSPLWASSPHVLDKVIAIVNEDVITESEVNAEVQRLQMELTAKHTQVPPLSVLKKQVLKHLIDVDIQLQIAKGNHVDVENSEIDDTINKIAEHNRLSLSELREALEKQGMQWDAYRKNIRKEIIINHVQQHAIGKDIHISSQQVEDFLKTALQEEKQRQTYHLQNIIIPVPEEPSPEQVKQAHAKALEVMTKIQKGADFGQLAISESSGEFALNEGDLGERHLAELPEVFAKEVTKMSVGQVSAPIRTGNGFQLIKLVGIGGDDLHHQVEKTHARHILIKAASHLTEADAKQQAQNIYQQLQAGKNFETMAKQHSIDVLSANKGGDLGWVVEDELVPQFADAMKKLPLNKPSAPIKTPYGWHIIEVLERKSIDDSAAYQRQKVRQFLQQRKFQEAIQNWQQHVRAQAYVKILDNAYT